MTNAERLLELAEGAIMTETELLPCPFCDGPTEPYASVLGATLVRHEGRPHCPIPGHALTREQWQHRLASQPRDIILREAKQPKTFVIDDEPLPSGEGPAGELERLKHAFNAGWSAHEGATDAEAFAPYPPTRSNEALDLYLCSLADRNLVTANTPAAPVGESVLREALEKIAAEQHEPGCRFQFAPFVECPTCPGPAKIARTALGGQP